MWKRFVLAVAGVVPSVVCAAKEEHRPRLVVQVVVSQMRYEDYVRFSKNYSATGFKLMAQAGAECDNARYNYMITNTPAGLATITTGSNPSTHGIVSDKWLNYTTNALIPVIDDDNYFGLGCDETDGQFSPYNLVAETVGDGLKAQNRSSKVVSIALTPQSSVISGGALADYAFWFDIHSGNWVTSTYYCQDLPLWVGKYNTQRYPATCCAVPWENYTHFRNYLCTETKEMVTNGARNSTVGNIASGVASVFKGTPEIQYRRLLETPSGNDALMEFAKQTVIQEQMGADETPDMLLLTLDPHRYIGEKYGTESAELEDSYYRTDKFMADLIEFLDVQVGKEKYLLVVTSDHGMSNTAPKYSRQEPKLFGVLQFKLILNGFLNTQYGMDNWVVFYNSRHIYLNRNLIYKNNLSLAEVQNQVANFALQFRGVSAAVTSSALQASYFAGGDVHKIQNGFSPRHSGDVILNFFPGWIEEVEGRVSMSESMYEYDVHVPLLLYGFGIRGARLERDVDMTDLAPSVAKILDIPRPNAATGRVIPEVLRGQ